MMNSCAVVSVGNLVNVWKMKVWYGLIWLGCRGEVGVGWLVYLLFICCEWCGVLLHLFL